MVDQNFVMTNVSQMKPEQKVTVIIISLPDTTVASKGVLLCPVCHNL